MQTEARACVSLLYWTPISALIMLIINSAESLSRTNSLRLFFCFSFLSEGLCMCVHTSMLVHTCVFMRQCFCRQIIACALSCWLWWGELCRHNQKECSISTNGEESTTDKSYFFLSFHYHHQVPQQEQAYRQLEREGTAASTRARKTLEWTHEWQKHLKGKLLSRLEHKKASLNYSASHETLHCKLYSYMLPLYF